MTDCTFINPYGKISMDIRPIGHTFQRLPCWSRRAVRFEKGHVGPFERVPSPSQVLLWFAKTLSWHYGGRQHWNPDLRSSDEY